jgi:hypothetical protein
VKEVIFYEKNNNFFKNFIDKYYKLRLQSPKGTAMNLLVKIAALSVYGRFGLNFPDKKSMYVLSTKKLESLAQDPNIVDLESHPVPVLNVALLKNLNLTKSVNKQLKNHYFANFSTVKQLQLAERYSEHVTFTHCKHKRISIQIASAICSYARIELTKGMMSVPFASLGYVDTDSILTTSTLDPKLVDEKKLGLFKLEVPSGRFFRKKWYILQPDTLQNSEEYENWLWANSGLSKNLLNNLKNNNPTLLRQFVSDTVEGRTFKASLTESKLRKDLSALNVSENVNNYLLTNTNFENKPVDPNNPNQFLPFIIKSDQTTNNSYSI